jgi:excisionase family DNA binding protein
VSKSELLVTLATLPDGDARLAAVASALAGQTAPERPASLRLYRMGEAANESGIGRCTLWRMIRDGRLRSVEVRKGSRRIPESELRRLVEGRAL